MVHPIAAIRFLNQFLCQSIHIPLAIDETKTKLALNFKNYKNPIFHGRPTENQSPSTSL
jgi:hypothetical protein